MAATHTIRTTMRPGDEITVDHDEYEFLLEKGLIYDGTPPVEPADPFDTRFAEYFADPESATMVELRAASVAAAKDSGAFVAGSVLNSGGAVVPTKRLHVILTADGLDIDDLIIEDVA